MKFSIVPSCRLVIALASCLLLHPFTQATHAATTTLIASNSNWHYLADGSNQGTAWHDAAFDDSGWSNGVAKFGFGGDGELTPIGFATNGFITFYFRTSFIEPGTNLYTQLQARLLRDDGAVVYLNGAEIFRQNMPTGAVSHLTQATAAISGTAENTFFATNVSAALLLLQPGLNTLAVEVHQSTNTSSDLGFNFELVALSDTTPPSVSLTNPISPATFIAGDNIALSASASDASGVAQVEFYANGQLLGTDTTAPYTATLFNARFGGYTLTAVAQDLGGLRATSGPVNITVTLDPQRVTLVQNRACWHYWDRGMEPAEDWRLPGFEDHAWKVGFAELGYGDGDEATVVNFGPSANNKFVTTYFRHNFNLVNHGDYTNLVLRLKRDDGAVVYLNGTEIFRDNLPTGPVTYSTLATNATDDGASYFTANINPLGLLEDENVIAVEVHQTTTNSSDLSFDLQLLGETGWMSPPLAIEPASAGAITLSWPSWAPTNFILQSRATFDALDGWTTLPVPPSSATDRQVVTLPGALPGQFYRLCASGTGPASCQPPLVLDQPFAIAAEIGSNVVLSVEAVGAPGLTYLWRRNEVFLPGATSSTLILENAQVADGGTYDVLVGNACGCTPSCPILVTVGASPVTLADNFGNRLQTNSPSGTVTGSNAVATREPGEPHNPAREFDHTVWLEWIAPFSGVAVVSTEGSGQDTSLAVYTGNALISLSLEASAGPDGRPRTSSVTFNAVAGTAYQIAADGNAFSPLMTLSWNLTPMLACVPQIVVPPVAQVVAVGSNTTLSVVAASCPGDPIAYQWFKGGLVIPDATNANLTVAAPQLASAATYAVQVMNSAGSTRSGGIPIIVVNSGSISIPREEFIRAITCNGKKFTNMLSLCYKSSLTTIAGCPTGDYQFMFPDAAQNQSQPSVSSLSLKIDTFDMANSGIDTALRLSTHNGESTCNAPGCTDSTATYACSRLSSKSISFGTCKTPTSYVKVTVFFNETSAYPGCVANPLQPVIVNHLYP